MAPGIGKGFSTISSILGFGRNSKHATEGHKNKPRTQDDIYDGQRRRSSSEVARTPRYANFARQLPRRKRRPEEQPKFSIAEQVMYAARDMVALRFWQDYGAWVDRNQCDDGSATNHVGESERQAECVVLHASERSCVSWLQVSQRLEKEQKELQELEMQGISIGTREIKEDFPYFAEVHLAVVRVFGRDGLSPEQWIWELHEYVRRKMILTFMPEYNCFKEMVRRKEWLKMAEWIHRDLFKIEHAFPSLELEERYILETALLSCSNTFFLQIPRISEDGVQHFYPKQEWLDRPPTPPTPPTPPPPNPSKPKPEQAVMDMVDERTLMHALERRSSNLATCVTRRASRLRRGRPASFVL
ncbi:hypothetical protein HDK77DRAFT_481505 [Phyllosticta capitalensis]